jgi:diguanylate cyclase (GGDEF)-like protein/PAS domain S-box-containing protein
MEPQPPPSRGDPVAQRLDVLGWFDSVFAQSASAWVLVDDAGRVLAANSATSLLLGRHLGALLSRPLGSLTHRDDAGQVAALLGFARPVDAEPDDGRGRVRFAAPDGEEIPTSVQVRPLEPEIAQRGPATAVLEIRDLRPTLSRALADAQALSHAVLDSVSDGILVVTRSGHITRANASAERILGVPAGGLLGMSVHPFVPEQVRARHAELITHFSSVGPHVMGAHRQLTGLRSDGTSVPLEVTLTEVQEYGKGHVCAVIRDVTDRVEFETRLLDQARTDALTGLPNRAVLAERLDTALARLARHGGEVAVLIADLDNFKAINDVYGHAVGDSTLIAVADRLRQAVRGTDTLVRLGGDEFAVIAEDLDPDDPNAAMLAVAERMRAVVGVPLRQGTREVRASLSIGAFLTRGPVARDTMLANADLALYEAKRNGRNTVVGFDPGMRAQATRAQTVREQLHHALERDELVTHYQPLVDISTGRIVGVESLVRWNHPKEGLLLPGAFLPVAVLDDLIVEIDLRVLELAVRDLLTLGPDVGRLWLNVAGATLGSGRLPSAIPRVLAAAGISSDRLTLEISESALPTDSPRVIAALSDLVDVGVELAIDDFGTGYCSLAHLTRLPLHAVKLDRSFLANDQSSALVPGLVSILRALQLLPVVEGIETDDQLVQCREAGATLGQGFGIARPMPLEALDTWLAERPDRTRQRST